MQSDNRRRALMAALIASLAPGFSSAAVRPRCPANSPSSSSSGSLTIDVHAHFFNGSDLQIRDFLSETTVGPDSELYPLVSGMGGILQGLVWHHAPSAAAERQAIAQYKAKLQACADANKMRAVATDAYQRGYTRGRKELQKAASALATEPAGAEVLGPTAEGAGLGAAIADLPPSFHAFELLSADATSTLGSQPDLIGYIQFVLHHFHYRYVNAIDYLTTYSKGAPRKIDLVVANMVDYDYWLARGKPTPTSLTDQIGLMREISVLLGGKVHGFAPFCPFRESMTKDARGIGDSMRLVRRAIEECGFIGVKLYPPMGFAPWGNSGANVWQHKTSLLPAASHPQFGQRLDAAMEQLFSYCCANDVPVMAHTNHSNGPYEEFKKLAGSAYWKLALEKFPGLSVSFGHFGDTDIEDHQGKLSRPFLKLMSKNAGSSGEHAFADSAYFAGALMSQQKMRDTLRGLYAGDNKIMLERLMYGTDWTMTLPQKNVERYLSDFAQVMQRIESVEPGIGARGTSLSNAFFGRNAAEFLGLMPGRGNRVRLNAFYERNKIPTPDWMLKL